MKLQLKSDQPLVFRLIVSDADSFEAELTDLVQKSPDMLRFAPIVLEPAEHIANLEEIVRQCRKHSLNPVAVRSAMDAHQQSAAVLELPCWKPARNGTSEKVSARETKLSYRVHSKPVRSGQQIYARDSHLIISKSVGAGAEVMADGDIHIYGELRGRAMAGVSGRIESRIFCHSMQAELLAIAGHYIVSDDMPDVQGMTQVFLDQDTIQFQQM